MEFTTAALVAAAAADISTGFWVAAAREADHDAIVCALAFSVATIFWRPLSTLLRSVWAATTSACVIEQEVPK